MKNSVLLLDDESDFSEYMTMVLVGEGLDAFGTDDFKDAAYQLFSEHPPEVFVIDLKCAPRLTETNYKDFETGTFGPSGALELIKQVQEKVKNTRIILISAIDPKEPAAKSGAFAYLRKPIADWDNSLTYLIDACRLGPIRPEEVDRTGKLKVGPYDLRSEQFRSYLEQFRRSYGRERE